MQKPKPIVLVVDRECEATGALISYLRAQELEVVWARDGEAAFNALDQQRVDCLVTELEATRIEGGSVLRRALERNPEVCAVVIAEGAAIDGAVEAMRQGAYDFQVKPLNFEKLLQVLRRGLSHQALAARVVEIEEQLDDRLALDRLTGRSRSIQRIMDQVRSIAATRATVLIEGESGTGKGLVAQAIHRNGPRRGQPFVWVDLSALASGVVESELFGHERGAAVLSRGRFEIADGGTLFLDEIGDTPLAVQVKLLRFIQDRAFERVGGTETLKSDVRLVAATQRDLAADVKAGRFREDLYYRLSVVRIAVPPLRERREDLPLLIEAFVREFNREHGRKVSGITRGVLDRFMRYPWPGNVRELENAIEGMVAFAEGKRALDLSDLPPALREESEGAPLEVRVGMTVSEGERLLVAATLEHTGGDKTRAAAMLGIGLRTLYRKIHEYGLR